ncbi:MAG: CAP domain-containing protein [Caldilineaceae bacterium]
MPSVRRFAALIVSFLAISLPVLAQPLTPDAPPAAPALPVGAAAVQAAAPQVRLGLTVNPQDPQASLDFYNQQYRPTEELASGWSGDPAHCNASSTSSAFRDAILRRINYFRAMAGVPADVTFSDEYNQKAQAAALMMSANKQLNHTPPTNWNCYSQDGAKAAGSSNLFLGVFSVKAIDGYMEDPGDGNYFLGHRRWLLHPQTQVMGTGDIPATSGYPPANALWVFDDHIFDPTPATRDGFVAWPPPGFVPNAVIYPRWSFSYPNADFSQTQIVMTANGQDIPLKLETIKDGFGQNTVVWTPSATILASNQQTAAANAGYTIKLSHVLVDGQAREFAYTTTIFDPALPLPTLPRLKLFIPLVKR